MVVVKWILSICFLLNICLAFPQGFVVDDYHVDIYLNRAGYFDVNENYKVTFTESKHGIYRNLITEYQLKNELGKVQKRTLVIDHVDVPHHTFSATSKLRSKLDGQLEIKIGNEDQLIEGKQEYTIKYRVHNAFLFTDSRSKFYWNVKGNDWSAVFKQMSFAIHLPDGPPLTNQDYSLYTGENNNTTADTTAPMVYANGQLTWSSPTNSYLNPKDNVTVLIALPAGYIEKPALFWHLWQQWGWLSFLLLMISIFYYAWWAYGRDRSILNVVHYFPPKGMDPAMAGYLINEQEDTNDLISLIPSWGTLGLISLKVIPKDGFWGKEDLLLIKLKELPDQAKPYEKVMFNGLFVNGRNEVLVSTLENVFYKTLSEAKSSLRKEAQQYYHSKSNQVRKTVVFVLIVMTILGFMLSLFFWTLLGAAIIAVSGLVMLFMHKVLNQRNEFGDQAIAEVQGFKMFVKTAEVEKLRILLKEDAGYFEKSLSYAVAFGLLKKWGEKFDPLEVNGPTWYHSASGSTFSAHHFSDSFSSSLSKVQSVMVSTPSSSGGGSGGSSGGGFGGGGGGSW